MIIFACTLTKPDDIDKQIESLDTFDDVVVEL